MILKAFIKIYCMIPIKFRASCIPCDKVIKATTQVAVDYDNSDVINDAALKRCNKNKCSRLSSQTVYKTQIGKAELHSTECKISRLYMTSKNLVRY